MDDGMPNTKVKQTNKIELEWKSDDERMSIKGIVTNGIISSVTIHAEHMDGKPRGSFLVQNVNQLESLIGGLRQVYEEATSVVWEGGIVERKEE